MSAHSSRKLLATSALSCIAILATASVAFAQDFNRVAPNQPKPDKPGAVLQSDQSANPAAAENQPLLDSLKGLRLVDDAKKIVRTGVTGTGISADEGLPLLRQPELVRRLNDFIGKPLGTADLLRVKAVIVEWYRTHDLPVVDVAFPAQDITGGTLQAVVTVYKLGQVSVKGNQWFSDSVITGPMHLARGEPVDVSKLKQDLNLMNRNPFRQVGAVLEKSQTTGDIDLALNVEDHFPFRLYTSIDNEGVPVTGRDQYSFGFNWGNAFGLDHQLSYRFMTSPDLWRTRDRGAGHSNDPRLLAHAFTYSVPFDWGDTVTVFGSYVQQVPNLGTYFDQVGHSTQLSLRYEKSLPAIWNISQQLQVGFDYKRTDNNLAFGGTSIFATATNVEQFLLIYGATLNDALGQTALQISFTYSPGGWSDGNNTAKFVAYGISGAKANYVYDNLQLTRITYLPGEITSVIRLNAQLSNAELLPSEQLGAGGTDSVRGYDPRTASASQGVLASLELRSPTYSPLKQLDLGIEDSGQLLAFYDGGFIADLHHQTGAPKSASLQSVGFGALYGVGRYFDVKFDYGWQLAKAPGASSLGNLANLSVTLAY